jgi:putative hemolysin
LFGLAFPIVVVLALILVNGLFAMAEIALVSSKRYRLEQQAEAGSTGARAALALLKDPTRFLSTAQIGITLVAIISGVFGEASISHYVTDWLEGAGLSHKLADTLSAVIVVLSIGYLAIVFGELVPKQIGLRHPEAIAGATAVPMTFLSGLSSPVVAVLSASSRLLLGLLGLQRGEEAGISEEEIRLLIGQSAESGSVDEAEAELLDRVFHFGDRQVHEVMTPRTETVWLPHDASLRDFYAIYGQTPHSRFPVFEDSPDSVVGILGIKDVLAALAGGRIESDRPISSMIRPAFFVPETKPVGDLFREMQSSGTQMAIAIDEFGGTAGIVTLEQLLEEMVGPVRDELRPGAIEVQTIDARTLQVDGSLSVEEARDELGLEIPDGPYDTIAGFVLSALGRIPAEGEQVAVPGHRITVVEMRGPKIESLRVTAEGASGSWNEDN